MSMLDHWHPMLPASALKSKPMGAHLAGHEIVLFRGRDGRVGACDDMCPHRRMRLSLGSIVDGELQCKYHGWTFDCDGNGSSPATPKFYARIDSYDTCEKYGYIWLKARGSQATMPAFDADGWCSMAVNEHFINAPLELVLDNFTEVEHTPMTHQLFGFDLSRMKDVTVRYEPTETTVAVSTSGPAKRVAFIMRLILGIGENYHFNDNWTTYFSPVYSVFDHYWTDPLTGAEAPVRWRAIVFFVPLSATQTRTVTFTYAKSRWPIPGQGGLPWFRAFTRRQVDREIGRDRALLDGLASHDTALHGMKLSRFDRTLGLNRERIERIYRGTAVRPNSNGAGHRLALSSAHVGG